MPRAGLSPRAVIDAALEMVDESGAAGLTLAGVAARTGVAVPSLYKHVEGLPALRRKATAAVLDEFTARLTAAVLGRSGPVALDRFLRAYRDYARERPGRYQLTVPAADAADPADREVAEAGARAVAVAFALLEGAGITGEQAVHATRCLRAAVHGFVLLEISGGFGLSESTDASFDRLVAMLTAGIFGG
ncbi:WHG domain-containing protein [Actinocrinis puniceicyclus]|uniref:WHG domain-containing protein n=1 Tax=Actinocrinis puniceicyclus TaxID=977794 RepID=A0A8J8BFH2_9ACTN|nr:TetR-like C-terminal domain-containing protein [Actinocrinis puniceicyclus]MBS2966171.1 WHG domain-containing protein [Actinocrinis puniceicyclus]